MKRKILNLITFIVFLLLMVTVLVKVYDVVRWKDTTGGYVSSLDQLYNTKDGLMDVVFVGSSHTYCAMLPSVFWEKYGIAAFDMSVSGQDKISALYEMRELFKHQSPKLVVVDAFALSFDRGLIEGNDYRNLLSMKASVNSVKHVLEFFKDRGEGMDKVPDYLSRWPIVHTRYRELARYDFVDYYPNSYARGEGINFHVDPSVNLPYCGDYTFSPEKLSEKNEYWLESLKDMSEEYGFELCFMVIPYKASFKDQTVFDSASVYAKDKGWDFLDFNRRIRELPLVFSEDFADEYHLNSFGALKFSDYLADHISERYDLPDRRDDERYSQWDLDSRYISHLFTNNRLEQINDLSGLTDAARSFDDDYSLFISTEYSENSDKEKAVDLLRALGAKKEELPAEGLWLYRAGNLSLICDYSNMPELPFSLELPGLGTLDVRFNGENAPGNIRVGYEDYSNTGSAVSLFLYDGMLREISYVRKY